MSEESRTIERVLGGDSNAFESLMRIHQDRLFHSIRQMVGDYQEAEDIAQDSFLNAFRKLSQFRGDSSFYTWLFRITVNVIQSRRRKRKVPIRPSVDGNQRELDALGKLQPVDARLLAADQTQFLQSALQSIADEYREILVLREIEDFDYETIASMLEIPVGTVRSRLHRARVALQQKLVEVSLAEKSQ